MCSRARYLAALITAAALAGCCDLAAGDLPADFEVVTARPAASFIRGDAITFVIRCNRPSQDASWRITDHTGVLRAAGTIGLGAERAATLRVRERLGLGYYTLALTLLSGAVVDTPFCVLPSPDHGRGDGAVFGLGYVPRSETEWEILAQMGGRHIRAEFPWPEVEWEQGVYRYAWVNGIADAAQRHGMQLTVLTGHTPRMYGVRPLDAQGVSDRWYKWQPARTVEWYNFIQAMTGTLLGRRLEADARQPGDTIPRTGRRFVRAWEIWSEADQSFYYGDWNRYLDMLRIAYGAIRSRERVPVVYGSCGHMTEMNFTNARGSGSFFDMVAYHPHGSDPDYELMHWFRNMPQALLARGAMRDTAFSECDFHADDSAHEPGFVLRLAATLRAWQVPLYVRSGCTGGVISANACPYGLVWIDDGRYVPRPAYLAFALARYLLEPAQYVGPVPGPEGVRLELFMRDGVPLLVAWTDGSAQSLQVQLGGGATLIDCLGGTTALRGSTATIEVSQDTVAVLGVAQSYLLKAANAAIERWLTTELGHVSPHNSAYVDPLERDAAACFDPDFGDGLRAAVDAAGRTCLRHPPQGTAAFYAAQRIAGDGMLEAARRGQEDGSITRLHMNTIWRLAQVVEHLGAIADGVGARWQRMHNVTSADLAKTRAQISGTRDRIARVTGGGQCPFADRLLDRAESQLEIVETGGGHARGAWWAATLQARAAHALSSVERPELLRATMVAEFPTSRALAKGTLLDPGTEHQVVARVYNFLPQPLTGALRFELPDDWAPSELGASFTAPAGGVSEPVTLSCSIPGEPTPWVQKIAPRVSVGVPVDLPPPLEPSGNLRALGELSPLQPRMAATYMLLVGSYPSQAPAAESTRLPTIVSGPAERPSLTIPSLTQSVFERSVGRR